MKVGMIGGGVMGEAMLGAALDRRVFAAEDVVVADVAEHRRAQLSREYNVGVTAESGEAMDGAGLVILSVKPQDMHSVHGAVLPEALLLSIMAGVPIRAIAADFHHDRIVRVMPNLLVAAKAGMSVWTATPEVTDEQRELSRDLLSAMGREIYTEEEKKLDMVTAVSGSGPGYIFLFIEAMVEGAVAVGLPRAQAEEMVLQTFYGAAVFAQESGHKPADLRAMVTSPAGTTAAGLLELEKAGVRGAIMECIRAAYQRAQELGGMA